MTTSDGLSAVRAPLSVSAISSSAALSPDVSVLLEPAPAPERERERELELELELTDVRVNSSDDSYYWDPATMAPLHARSAAAIARLRAFRPAPFPTWDNLPLSRRAAVLVLLYADRRGDLRVVLTMRAASLRSFSGHAAFPGGKADTLDETPEQIARREAWEEIGLPMEDMQARGAEAPGLPSGFRIEHLCQLPCSLAKTELAVRPVVALLHADEVDRTLDPTDQSGQHKQSVRTADELIPRLDAKEVAAVFSAPFHNFLLAKDEILTDPDSDAENAENSTALPPATATTQAAALASARRGPDGLLPKLPPGPWYEGNWIRWKNVPWRAHYFYVPVVGQRVAKPRKRVRQDSSGNGDVSPYSGNKPAALVAASRTIDTSTAVEADDSDGSLPDVDQTTPGRYKVWGMTARILVDAATVAYGETPEFPHNIHFGDEALLADMEMQGLLGEKQPQRPEPVPAAADDQKDASKM